MLLQKLCSGFRATSRTILKQASFTLPLGELLLVCCGYFNSSRVEEVTFVPLQLAAFITSTFIRDCRDTSAFLPLLTVLEQIFWVMPVIFNSLPFLFTSCSSCAVGENKSTLQECKRSNSLR